MLQRYFGPEFRFHKFFWLMDVTFATIETLPGAPFNFLILEFGIAPASVHRRVAKPRNSYAKSELSALRRND